MATDTLAIPETVEVPADVLVEAAARLYAFAEISTHSAGFEETAEAREAIMTAYRLLDAAAPGYNSLAIPFDDDARHEASLAAEGHPVVVEARARECEILADFYERAETPEQYREAAARVREMRDARASDAEWAEAMRLSAA